MGHDLYLFRFNLSRRRRKKIGQGGGCSSHHYRNCVRVTLFVDAPFGRIQSINMPFHFIWFIYSFLLIIFLIRKFLFEVRRERRALTMEVKQPMDVYINESSSDGNNINGVVEINENEEVVVRVFSDKFQLLRIHRSNDT